MSMTCSMCNQYFAIIADKYQYTSFWLRQLRLMNSLKIIANNIGMVYRQLIYMYMYASD